jgi:hypothetical protein
VHERAVPADGAGPEVLGTKTMTGLGSEPPTREVAAPKPAEQAKPPPVPVETAARKEPEPAKVLTKTVPIVVKSRVEKVEKKEPKTQELDFDDFLTEPNVRVPAKTDPNAEDERAAGLPRVLRPGAKRIVIGAVAVAAAILVVAGLQMTRARQQREAEEALARHATPAAAPSKETSPPLPLPTQAMAPKETLASAAAPGVPPSSVTSAAASVASVAPAPPPAAARVTAIAAGPTTPSTPSNAVATSPRAPTAPGPAPQEAPPSADTRPEPGGGSLIAQASRALRNGTLVKAVELARQAVSANPSDADAWLTLGAAYQATGDTASARQAYRTCTERAKTANVMECRLLAGH